MARPKVDYEFNDQSFVNPYNFVRTDFDKKPTSDIASLKPETLLFGSLDYSILTKTPLAIPDTEKVKTKNEHKRYPFMKRTDGKLMIPGSGIRGVIRNVYETVTDSCYATSKDDQFITSRQVNPGEAGLLFLGKDEDGKTTYSLYSAKYYMLKSKVSKKYDNGYHGPNEMVWDESVCPSYPVRSDKSGKYITFDGEKLRSGDRVHFNELRDSKGNQVEYRKGKFSCGAIAKELTDSDGEEGILVIGEDIFNKHHERIFKQGKLLADIDSTKLKKSFAGLLTTLEMYRDPGINKNYKSKHSGYSSFDRMKKNGIIPVYYKWDTINLYLQFACIGRIAFNNDMNDLIRMKKPCKDRKQLCKACSLFGMIGGTNDNAIGSRVRFSDAICESDADNALMGYFALGELGMPRSAYMPFYSTMNRGKDANKVGFDDPDVSIRGRKYYWHHQPSNDMLHADETKRNATMELAKDGVSFKGKIYFDGITEAELEELVWALNFWENDPDGRYCHKIGHGKPLGLGSCKITVDGVTARKYDGQSYKLENVALDYEKPAPVKNSETLIDLLKICDFHAMDGFDVRYPYVVSDSESQGDDNDCAAHRWFTHNKNNRGFDNSYDVHTLPSIDENQELPAITAKIPERSFNQNNNYNNRDNKRRKNNGKYQNKKKRW